METKILTNRTRGAANKQATNHLIEETLKQGQQALLDKKLEELTTRYERNEIQVSSKK